jgi:glycosyltransferase involved in cell wall biosynthesis
MDLVNNQVAPARPKLLFLIAEDWFFWSHRLHVARTALLDGYEVIVATSVNSCEKEIRDEGFRFIPLKLMRHSYSPLTELRVIHQLRQIYKHEAPDIVYHLALKPILYGSIAGMGRKNIRTINALAGLGYLAGSSTRKANFLRLPIWNAFRFFLNRRNQRVLVENQDDKQLLVTRLRVPPDRITIIRGSGVDLSRFQPTTEPAGTPLVLLASRMLWIKGIRDFVEAAKLLRDKGIAARFVLAGDTDLGNFSCIPRQQLLEWHNSRVVEWWGHQHEMTSVFEQANLVCLPSHGGEGVPTVLMEAAASGRAIVTTDVPGCRDIVRQGVNGILVPPRNAQTLSQAIEKLLKDPVMRLRMGSRSREIAAREFSQDEVAQQTLALCRELLRPCVQPVEAAQGTANEL